MVDISWLYFKSGASSFFTNLWSGFYLILMHIADIENILRFAEVAQENHIDQQNNN